MSTEQMKSRFAPSPTGLLHLGNVRTALFSWLVARRAHGRFLLRLEDTDAARGHTKYAEALAEDLRWLGLVWDEGPGVGGPDAPYAQSERGAIYAKYMAALVAGKLAYPCFCTEHELAVSRKTALAAGRPPRYSGKCRRLSHDEVEALRKEGRPSTLRFHVADGESVVFDDRVRGPQSFNTSDIGDFVIRRSDGTPAFFFCNAVDDALMGVTLVLRGEDHLTNTPRQILLLQALGLRVPDYAHMALVVGADGAPLSKRTGSQSVEELRQKGYLPIAVNNYLARLGHTYDETGLLSMEQLAASFSPARLHRAPARFDEQQMLHWQKEAVKQASVEELWVWLTAPVQSSDDRIEQLVSKAHAFDFVEAIRDNIVFPADAFIWAGNLYASGEYLRHEAREVIRATGAPFFETAREQMKEETKSFREFARGVGEHTRTKGKTLFMPLRAALTGETHGPEMERLWGLLGAERIVQRLKAAIDVCHNKDASDL